MPKVNQYATANASDLTGPDRSHLNPIKRNTLQVNAKVASCGRHCFGLGPWRRLYRFWHMVIRPNRDAVSIRKPCRGLCFCHGCPAVDPWHRLGGADPAFCQQYRRFAPCRGSTLDLTLRYVTNTTEQVVLFVLAAACLALVDAGQASVVLPVLGLWFAVARAMFFFGYRFNPIARSVGFAATFHPTIDLFCYGCFRLIG